MDLSIFKILIVDDTKFMRVTLRNSLTKLGFKQILEAQDANEGLLVLNDEKVDLIISDWNMPGITGLEMLMKIKQDQKLKNIPFIIITADASKENVINAVKAGVSNYLVKPFTDAVLYNKTITVLKNKGLLR